VMLDSPVQLPWDVSLEMSAYVQKLPHVSVGCRLSQDEELALLQRCVCEPADPQFNHMTHTVYCVLVCYNRRSELRARAADGNASSCAIELPPRPAESRWIYDWQDELVHVTPERLDELLDTLAMKYSHSRLLMLDTMLELLSALNNQSSSATLHNGGFLLLYAMFSGATRCEVVDSDSCGASFATLLLPLFDDVKEPSLLGSILLTMARKPLFGGFLPRYEDTRKYKRRDVLTGKPLPDEEVAPLGQLLKSVVSELHSLGGSDKRAHDDVARRMVRRRVDALTKQSMWGFGWGGVTGGGISGGGRWGGGGWGGGWTDTGWTGGGYSYRRIEEVAEKTEKQAEDEISELAKWRMLQYRSSLQKLWPGDPSQAGLQREEAQPLLKVSDHACESRVLQPVRTVHLCTRADNCVDSLSTLDVPLGGISLFARAPLEALGLSRYVQRVSRATLGQPQACDTLGFDVAAHPDAKSKVARDMQARLAADVVNFAGKYNSSLVSQCTFIPSPEAVVRDDGVEARGARVAAESALRELIDQLHELREKDGSYVRRALAALLARARTVEVGRAGLSAEEGRARELFFLRQLAEQEGKPSLDLLLTMLISSRGADDLRCVNPFLSKEEAEELLDLAVAAVLHSSRIGQVNRCLVEAVGLLKLLGQRIAVGEADAAHAELASAIALKAQALSEQLLAQRHFVREEATDDVAAERRLLFDPRFLLFEFTHNIMLRKAQVQLVEEFVGAVHSGVPLVKQMLMGGGKTTVVSPLLALLLGDGERLVVQTMPPALLEQSKATLRTAFSSIVRKRVFTLSFDRSSELTWATVEKLASAARNRGVVLCTASTIKSLQLKLLEKLDSLRDTRRKVSPAIEADVRCLAATLKLFDAGLLIMDEVDLLLHPLKSELNFPISEKSPLDFSPERWTCAIHALDAVFFVERGSMSVGFRESGRAHTVLAELSGVIAEGYRCRALQRSPHLVLLNPDWYVERMLPVMGRWMLLWLEANHATGLAADQMLAYIMNDGLLLHSVEWEAEDVAAAAEAVAEADPSRRQLQLLHARMTRTLDEKTFKLLNLVAEWLRTFLPHTLSKISRVSFGLLTEQEHQKLLEAEPSMPRSRLKLAIPFVGKDVPSAASEFAHPDIIIGLTVLAYRYQGLRRTDFEEDVMGLLRSDFEKETGPLSLRQSNELYERWVRAAGGVIKGGGRRSAAAVDEDSGRVREQRALANGQLVVPLWLLKQSNDEQMSRLYSLLRKEPATIHWYLEQIVFPAFMQHQRIKLSASGQELGGTMLFRNRLGFSGTPSDLLPLDLGRCGYEKGSEGQMFHVLTDPTVVCLERMKERWCVASLLRHVATRHYHALIDTGALITGLSNKDVAAKLLEYGLGEWCEGVVFLDDSDEKMVYVRASGRVIKLSQCGIPLESRFAFYDHIHTTGMDIKHALSARAALTLGKDCTFRDLAQGAFRMRGIGVGQTVTMLVIPEVEQLMARQLAKAGGTFSLSGATYGCLSMAQRQQALRDTVAWLVINSMRTERVQFDQLCTQALSNVWREQAFHLCINGHRHFRAPEGAASEYVLELLGEAFLSNKHGSVSRSKLDGKVLGLYFESHEPSSSLVHGLRSVYSNYEGGDGSAFEVVYVSTANSQVDFNQKFREMPWLAIPFAHAQRRQRLHALFGITAESNALVLLNAQGQLITRDGRLLVEIAHTCSSALQHKSKREEEIRKDREMLLKEKAKLADIRADLTPYARKVRANATHLAKRCEGQRNGARCGVDKCDHHAVATELLEDVFEPPRQLREIHEFLAEPQVSLDAQAALDAANVELKEAQADVRGLSPEAVEKAHSTGRPSPELREAVEGVCVLLRLRQDFETAQARLFRSAPLLERRLFAFDKDAVPKSAYTRLRSFAANDEAPPPCAANMAADGEQRICEGLDAVARVLRRWVSAHLRYDRASEDAKLSLEQVSCSLAVQLACECVCDFYGLDGVEDLRGALQLAAVSPRDKTEAVELAAEEEANRDDELAQIQKKSVRLKQFVAMLRSDVAIKETSAVQRLRSVQGKSTSALEPTSLNAMLACGSEDKLVNAVLTALLAATGRGDEFVESAGGPVKAMWSVANPVDKSKFEEFKKSVGSIPDQICEGRASPEHWGRIKSLAQLLDQNFRRHKLPTSQALSSFTSLCDFILEATCLFDTYAEMATKQAQLKAMSVELAETQKELEALVSRMESPAEDMSLVREVLKAARDAGVPLRREEASWALRRCNGNEADAIAIALVQPQARRALEALCDPACLGQLRLHEVTGVQVRKVRAALRSEALAPIADALAAEEDRKAEVRNGAQANGRRRNVAKAFSVWRRVRSGSKNEEPASPASPLSKSHGSRLAAAQGAFNKAVTSLKVDKENLPSTEPKAASRQASGIDASKQRAPEMDTVVDANGDVLLGTEAALVRWAVSVLDHFDVQKKSEPQEQKVMLLERRVADKERALTAYLKARRQEACKRAQRADMDASHLFPPAAPWSAFPWEAEFRPRSAQEDQLRQAIGLRDLGQLTRMLQKASTFGLCKANSRIFFEADSLRDLLAADAAQRPRSASVSDTRCVASAQLDAAQLQVLSQALNVFLEPINTDVATGVPRQRPFVEILSERAAEFEGFIVLDADLRVKQILGMVSDSVGVTDIETEQCREQEQEKEQEQEQEMEIDMERYVDVAYLRDGEEPRRWAFSALGEKALTAERPAPLADGVFYPASDFRLHSRSGLPLPPFMCVSRNHFNLEWVGERRLKNAVCVLEWTPDAALETVAHPGSAELDAQRRAALDKALAFLDVRGTARYGPREVREAVRCAEDVQISEVEAAAICADADGGELSAAELRQLLVESGRYRKLHTGRYFVLLSLAEAETIRCILHMRQGKELVRDANVQLALRCLPAGGLIFDACDHFVPAPQYMADVSQQCFRFVDSAMHYKPHELQLLLRSLPVSPAERRLFFSSVVGCRRRLAKRWEQTPLAKLFMIEDDWAMMMARALGVRVRAAISARGLMLHDAFLAFDADRNGMLDLAEVYGAIHWLGIELEDPEDVLFFVRGVTREAHLTFASFMQLLCPSAEGGPSDTFSDSGAAADPSEEGVQGDAVAAHTHSLSDLVVPPRGAGLLRVALERQLASERQTEERLEAVMAEQASQAAKCAQAECLSSDFGWLRATKGGGSPNPLMTRTSCFYDFALGKMGTQHGAPHGVEARGKWLSVRQGRERVQCIKGYAGMFSVLRVPFRKNGGGTLLNQYTVTLHCRVDTLPSKRRGLLCTAGWDQWSVAQKGDELAQLWLGAKGGVGSHAEIDEQAAGAVPARSWVVLTHCVDTVSGVTRTYVDGVEATEYRAPQCCKDGQHALKGRLAVFCTRAPEATPTSDYHLRSVAVHNHCLSDEQVQAEAAMLRSMLMDETIHSLPSPLWALLTAAEAAEPFQSVEHIHEVAQGMVAAASSRAAALWSALSAGHVDHARAAMDALGPMERAVCARWRMHDAEGASALDEATAPYGESLLHYAAFAGAHDMVSSLLTAGTPAGAVGSSSGFTPLHAAVAGGHKASVEALLRAKAPLEATSKATKRTALHLACLRSASALDQKTAATQCAIAVQLVRAGADPHAPTCGADSPIEMLRRLGGAQAASVLAAVSQDIHEVEASDDTAHSMGYEAHTDADAWRELDAAASHGVSGVCDEGEAEPGESDEEFIEEEEDE